MTFDEKDIGNYIVYSTGKVFSKNRNRFIKTNYNTTNGYGRVKIDGKTIKLHRLMMKVFVGDGDLEVNHIDGNKRNNDINNLEYVTRSQNEKHAYDTGLITFHKTSNKPIKVMRNGMEIGIFNSASSLSLLLGKNRQWLGNQLYKTQNVIYKDFCITYAKEK